MKKFIFTVLAFVIVALTVNYTYFYMGVYIPIPFQSELSVIAKTSDKQILLNKDGEYIPFEIKGVDIGSGYPGKESTDFAIDKETYMRWFSEIQEMGANTIRVYTVQSEPFYEAFYEYNKERKEPLYLLHGVSVNEHTMNSYKDAYHKEFYDVFLNDCKTMVDVIHGKRKLKLGKNATTGHGDFTYDISEWVIGYILGSEWDEFVVAYTDDKYRDDMPGYSGNYFYTSDKASAFETMLTKILDEVTEYETKRYNAQRLITFFSDQSTDPFEYETIDTTVINKCAKIDGENILSTNEVLSGLFASYSAYPAYPDYLTYVSDWKDYGIKESDFLNENGELNTYLAYLTMLNNHHSVPVVISEFGTSTSRATSRVDINTGRNMGGMNEDQQGEILAKCYAEIVASGCAGSCICSWQDEWFKRTWNTMYAVNLRRNPYWSDYQTETQFYGLLTFDPGNEQSVCYVDADVSEWTKEDQVVSDKDMSVSVKYDEKFLYLMVEKKKFDLENDILYLPIDTTQKTGSNYCENYDLKFDRSADFLLVISGKEDSRLLVQERYEALRSTYSQELYKFDTYEIGHIPEKTSPLFKNINLILQRKEIKTARNEEPLTSSYETGKLRYGNANPKSEYFDSLADFCISGDYIEIRLPWQLLNFADPSKMQIHDDYYDGNYGVDYIDIDKLYVGITEGKNQRTHLEGVELEGWGNKVTYHERLKKSYYIMKEIWGGTDEH